MIIITSKYKDKTFDHRYEGEINLFVGQDTVRINWFIDELPPQNMDELCIWRSNGFDVFRIENIVSIRGE